MIDRLEFLISEAVTALRRNGMMTIAAITTCAIALFIFGGLGLTYLSLSAHLQSLQSELAINVPLKASVTLTEAQEATRQVRKIAGVDGAVFLPKEVEWKKFLTEPGHEIYKPRVNPFPNQIRVLLKDLNQGDNVIEELKKLKQYDSKRRIRDANVERERVGFLVGFVRLFGGVLSLVSLLTAGTLIFNTVFLTVNARRRQIQIMSLIGASGQTIRWPFLLEGAIQGFVGGFSAALLLWATVFYIRAKSADWLGASSSGSSFNAFQTVIFLVALGVLLGMISAGLSVRRHLRLDV